MECAGIAEAGGVKNVTFSLCKEFSNINHNVTLFIPIYKCNSFDLITDYDADFIKNAEINHCGKTEFVSYNRAKCVDGNFNVIFIDHPAFSQKEAVYTYTASEQKMNPEFIKGTGHVDTLFMDSLFAKAVTKFGQLIDSSDLPDIIHCQDASTALIPAFVRNSDLYKNTQTVVTIHNAGPAYHHNFSNLGEAVWYTNFDENKFTGALNNGKIEPFLLAYNSGAYLTTVSENYAEELTDPANNEATEGLAEIFHNRNIQITGITNGIDVDRYDPSDINVSKLPFAFNPEKADLDGKYKCRNFFLNEIIKNKKLPEEVSIYGNFEETDNGKDEIYIVYHGRITTQKGIKVLIDAIPVILDNFDFVRFIITGQGELSLENALQEITNKYKGRVVFLNGYAKQIARLSNAVGDFIVLPSYFEPCGLEDFISQAYGTLPVAHATGGLKKIVNEKTGFLYENNTPQALAVKLSEVIAIKKYNNDFINNMIKYTFGYIKESYLWKNVIKNKYLPFFEKISKKS